MVYQHEDSLKERFQLVINEVDALAALMFAAANEEHLMGESGAILSGQVERLRELAELIRE